MPNAWIGDLDYDFDSTPATESLEFDKIPLGDHVVTIVDVNVREDKPTVEWSLRFSFDSLDRKKFSSFGSSQAAGFLKMEARKIGIELTKEGFDRELKSAVGLKVKVNVKNQKKNPDYQQFDFVEAVGRDREISANAIELDDIPF